MIRPCLILVLGLLMTGCGDRGGGSPSGPSPMPGPNVPTPGPKPVPTWGDLPCQKLSSCVNEVLNLSTDELVTFVVADFSNRTTPKGKSPEELMFFCGRHWGRVWDEHFAKKIEAKSDELADLFLALVDPLTCQVRNDFRVRLEAYFQNTEEYKIELTKR